MMNIDHLNGTFICLYPDSRSTATLAKVCKQLGIKEPVPSDKLHTTIVFSRNPMPDTQNHRLKKPVVAKVSDLDIWPDVDKKCLVVRLNSDELMALNKFYTEHYNASSDYPSFNPHLTLSYNYQNELLDFDLFNGLISSIQFDRMEVVPLDTNWLKK